MSVNTYKAAARGLERLSAVRPKLALILGSGFQLPARFRVEGQARFGELPGFSLPTVPGHAGLMAVGSLAGVSLIILSGRAHYYEGYSMAEVTFSIRVLAAFGVDTLILTNAAGAIHPRYRPGDFMGFSDHINLMGVNPLRPPNGPAAVRFVDLTAVYDRGLRQSLARAARRARVRWHEGVYLAVAGPTYETPAEIRAFRRLGADAVGMSTVPEAIVARECGLKVAAISCLTNLAAGRAQGPLNHRAVLAAAQNCQADFEALFGFFLKPGGVGPGE